MENAIKNLVDARISAIHSAEEAERKAREDAAKKEIDEYKISLEKAIRNCLERVDKLDTWYRAVLPPMPGCLNSHQRHLLIKGILNDKRIVWINDAYTSNDGVKVKIKLD